MNTPDPNAKAPRPAHVSSDDERKPDMDHAPPATRGDKATFDRGTEQADRIARTGTLPGSDDSDQDRGGADRSAEARAGRRSDAAGANATGRGTGDDDSADNGNADNGKTGNMP